jgi:AcrR family transcriptional regulator
VSRQPRFDRAAVLQAGLALADESGLAAVTMQAVARRVGVTPMALYREVADKADLLDGLVELLLTDFPAPDPDLPWEQRLEAAAAGLRRTARRHPAVFPLLLQRPATTPGSKRVREAVYAALAEAGVAGRRIARVERVISSIMLGFLVSEAGGRLGHHSRRVLDADFDHIRGVIASLIAAQVQASA